MEIQSQNKLLESITKITERKEKLMTQPELLLQFENDIDLISNFFDLERNASILLAVMICEQLMGDSTSFRKLMRQMGFSALDVINCQQWVKNFKKRGWISPSKRKFHSFKTDEFELSKLLIEAVLNNDKTKMFGKQPDTFPEALLIARKMISNAIDDCEVDEFVQQVMIELQRYVNFTFFFEIVNTNELIDIEKIMMVWMASDLVYGREEFDFNTIMEHFTHDATYTFWFKQRIANGSSFLVQGNYIEFKKPNFVDFSEVKFGDKMNHLLIDLRQNSDQKRRSAHYCTLIEPKDLCEQALFFNESEKKSVDKVEYLLNEINYKTLMCKFSENGMKECLTMLFHGMPGTGKTEFVKQLALKHQRSIYQVDISSIKDMWVGESEKNMKKVFREYANALKFNRNTPILLFNEADAILGVRTNVQHSIDQMYNSLQNILLQELEDMKGIFIATTNLINNIDGAFDRRLLYKQKFELPDSDTRFKILKSQFPEIAESLLYTIATQFELSGGQIQNIKRKLIAEEILFGEDNFRSELIIEYVQNEIGFRNGKNKIGFK